MKNSKDRPTPVFKRYFSWLICRLILFCASIWLLVNHPEQLDFTERFGFQSGLSFVNLAFCLMVIDLFTKLLPHASIAMGSRKQYGEYHVPTPRLFGGGVKELMDTATQLIANAPATLRQKAQSTIEETITSARETAQGVKDASRQIAYSVDVLGVLPWSEEDLTASEILRSDIRRRRQREIVPVLIFWIIFNALIWLLLDRFDVFNERTALVWTLFYFLFDMICVVLWCPLQLVLKEILIASESTVGGSGETILQQYRLANQLKYVSVIVSSVPILCLYPFVQKYFAQGVMIGSLKE